MGACKPPTGIPRLIFRFVPDDQQPLSDLRREVIPRGGLEWRQSSTQDGFIRFDH
nr:MAG TPA: hypothetical protein [Caudoviricetes sp.]